MSMKTHRPPLVYVPWVGQLLLGRLYNDHNVRGKERPRNLAHGVFRLINKNTNKEANTKDEITD